MDSQGYTPAHGKGKAWSRQEDKTSPRQPDYTGIANWNGDLIRVAMWHNPPGERSRKASYSIQLEAYGERATGIAPQKQRDFDDDAPF